MLFKACPYYRNQRQIDRFPSPRPLVQEHLTPKKFGFVMGVGEVVSAAVSTAHRSKADALSVTLLTRLQLKAETMTSFGPDGRFAQYVLESDASLRSLAMLDLPYATQASVFYNNTSG
jgi:hypothetical protein